MKKFNLFILLTLIYNLANAQVLEISGFVYAEETREPLAFANVFFHGTDKGFYSDFEGKFSWKGDSYPSDTIRFEYVGYKPRFVSLKDVPNRVRLEVELQRNIVQTAQVDIKLNYNPALKWVQLARDKRVINNPDKLESWECETFTKNTIAVNNINQKLKKGKFWKDIGPLFDTLSYISGDNSKAILPVFISEVLSDYYFNKVPYLTKEYILASNVKGVGVQDGTFVSQLLGSTFVNYNFYQNTLVVVDKGIISPIAESSGTLYNYKLVNVDKSGSRRQVQIYCEPKNSRDLAFVGYIWIEDTTGALVKLSLELNSKANINYIEKLRVSQEYAPTLAGAYFCINTRAVVDIAELSDEAAGVVATSVVSARNVIVNNPRPPKFYETRVSMAPDATLKPDSFWAGRRHFAASEAEKRVTRKIDTLIGLPRIKTYTDLANFLVDGYKNYNKIDLGPYYNLISYNQLEGFRMRLGFRTSYKFSRNWVIEGFGAYGFADQRWKYGFRSERILNRKRWTKLGFFYRRDVEQIGITDNENYSTGLFTAFNLLGSNNLNMNRDTRLMFGTDIRNGLRVGLTFGNRAYLFEKVGNFNFAYHPEYPDTTLYSTDFINTTLQLNVRYAPRFYFLQNDNRRVTFSGIGPEYYGTVIYGLKGVLRGQFNYTRIIGGVNYNKVWGSIGRTASNLELARVFGRLPYPLLNVYIGNQSFIYNTGAYNQMRIFEFITDRSISASLEHHFNGFIFNRIPLIRKLKWREIVGTKAIYGSLDAENFNIIPKFTGDDAVTQFKTFGDKPYWEVSFGIENILKILRIDAVWRLTYRNEPRVRNFGIKASVGLGF